VSRDVRATATRDVPVPAEPDVVLTLSVEAAKTLLALLRRVSGSVEDTYRRDTIKIQIALTQAGVSASDDRFSDAAVASALR
jgi:hypothetical protein